MSPKDRHVVATAVATHADAIVTFNLADFAAAHLKEHLQIEVIHPSTRTTLTTSSWISSISMRSAPLLRSVNCAHARRTLRGKQGSWPRDFETPGWFRRRYVVAIIYRGRRYG